MRACPDSDDAVGDYSEDRRTIALVTQVWRGEVATIDLHDRVVIDQDPSLPGSEFLPVGAMPTAIVSTPGGVASFVGVREPGREAIFALPTSCITAPKEGEPAREITLWSACRLPSRPGEMAIVVDSSATTSTCGDAQAITERWLSNEAAYGGLRDDCPANLEEEEQIAPVGRRKLIVTLPDEGKIAIFDAQSILNLQKGTFGVCVPDRVIALADTLPPTPSDQPLPDDLKLPVPAIAQFVPDGLKAVEPPKYSNATGRFESIPAGIASADNKLYIADLGIPLIHVVDTTDPCAAHEVEPLRPLDFDVPNRDVRVSSLSVSAMTLAGRDKHQRFLYALDADAGGTAMVFDLSDGASKAPVVRPHVPDLPFEAPDRIRFTSPIKRLQLVSRDVPAIDPATKIGEIGVACDPYPGAKPPGSLYRTSSDDTKGAGPRKLRGIFGAMALGSGEIAAVDIEDWDAPCRRPKANNPVSTARDWLGCGNDSVLGRDWFVEAGEPTVSEESSCNVIEPHRLRSGRHFRTDATRGVMAPSLVNFPRLSSPETGELATGKADELRKHPQLLAVPYVDTQTIKENDPRAAYLNVGTTRYSQDPIEHNLLDTGPAQAEHNTLILPMSEPRVYAAREDFTATFEGTIVSERTSGQLPFYSNYSAAARLGREIKPDEILLIDRDAWFCDQGVEAYNLAYDTGKELLANRIADIEAMKNDPDTDATTLEAATQLLTAMLDRFASTHADFVSLTEDFRDTNPYFKSETAIEQCGNRTGVEARRTCEAWFGTKDDPKPTRDFTIREAQSDDLVMVPRAENPAEWVARVHCCFPAVHSYVVRAGQQWVVRGGGGTLLHAVRSNGPHASCSKDDKSIRRFKLRSRAFEISSAQPCADPVPSSGGAPVCAIGLGNPDEEVCVLADQPVSGVSPNAIGIGKAMPQKCIFESLKGRMAIYRGREPSQRDMVFKWSITGGFSPMSTTIATTTVGLNVVPIDMVYSESWDALVVIDGASGGVNLIGLTDFAPLGVPYL